MFVFESSLLYMFTGHYHNTLLIANVLLLSLKTLRTHVTVYSSMCYHHIMAWNHSNSVERTDFNYWRTRSSTLLLLLFKLRTARRIRTKPERKRACESDRTYVDIRSKALLCSCCYKLKFRSFISKNVLSFFCITDSNGNGVKRGFSKLSRRQKKVR